MRWGGDPVSAGERAVARCNGQLTMSCATVGIPGLGSATTIVDQSNTYKFAGAVKAKAYNKLLLNSGSKNDTGGSMFNQSFVNLNSQVAANPRLAQASIDEFRADGEGFQSNHRSSSVCVPRGQLIHIQLWSRESKLDMANQSWILCAPAAARDDGKFAFANVRGEATSGSQLEGGLTKATSAVKFRAYDGKVTTDADRGLAWSTLHIFVPAYSLYMLLITKTYSVMQGFMAAAIRIPLQKMRRMARHKHLRLVPPSAGTQERRRAEATQLLVGRIHREVIQFNATKHGTTPSSSWRMLYCPLGTGPLGLNATGLCWFQDLGWILPGPRGYKASHTASQQAVPPNLKRKLWLTQ